MEETNVVLGPITSLMVWRAAMMGSIDMPYESLRQPDRMRSVARVRTVRRLDAVRELGNVPLDVIVGQPKRAHGCKSLNVITLKDQLPDGSLWSAGEGIYLCAPELCFVLLSRGGMCLHLLRLGCELCGTYCIAPDQTGSFSNCAQLTTVEKLRDYVSRLGQRHGVRQARLALRHMANNSDSPRETALFLMASLPDRMGGYGIRKAELNGRIEIPEQAQARLGKGFLCCDQVYRDASGKPIAVGEYDSNERHLYRLNELGDKVVYVEKVLADDERREVIVEQGAGMVTIRTEDTRDFMKMDAKLMRLGKLAGCEPRESRGLLLHRRMNLFSSLFDPWVWCEEHEMLRKMAGYDRAGRRDHSRRSA